MLKLLIYLKQYKKECILGPLFKLLEATFELMIPIIMANIIDKGIIHNDANYIWKMCFLMIVMGAIGLGCSLTAQFFAAKAAVGFSTNISQKLFEHIQNYAYEDYDKIGVSTLITRMTSDINQIQTGVNLVIRLFLRSPFIVFGAMLMAFGINVKIAIIFVIVIPLLATVVYGVMLITIPEYKKVQKKLDNILLAVRETVAGVRVIRALNYEEEEQEKFDEINNDLTKVQLLVGKISAIMNPVTYAIVNIGTVAIIREGAVQVNSGIITTGEVVALVNYMSQILVELVKLANLIVTVNKSVACGNRVNEVLLYDVSIDKSVQGEVIENVDKIEFENVSMKYVEAQEESITNVSFKIEKGETIGIIGPTGSGKTSLINLIPRYYDATSGIIKINGKEIKNLNICDLRKNICVVPQKSILFKGTIRDNIKIANEKITDNEIIEVLKKSRAYEFVMQKKDGIDYDVEQGGKNLSGGQKQRLAIARALATEASVIIFDDSMSALDYVTDAALRSELSKIKDKTKIIVSQRVASLGNADRIFVMDDGELVGVGSHEELISNNNVYQEIYKSQVKN